jgi:hypothetical protein
MAAIYHIGRQNASQIGKTPLCGIRAFSSEACPALDAGWTPVRVKKTRQNKKCLREDSFMPPPQAALRRQALVMAVAFPHHAVQEKTLKTPHPMPSAKSAGPDVCQSKNEERCGGE